jgi:hypothetical protein
MKCEVCEKYKENIREYFKLYRQRPYVKEKIKKYFKEYNARPDVKQARHEWYINKKIKEFVTTDRRYSNPQFNINAEILD